ncbi:MAG: energy-coupling factor transporter transmembrane protein EcfT, partial [Proteobacteria bacterium]|nr:energy-coupling factor transporter transmembrane protein EcfT [Pseudomonadota bacterium]
GALIVLVQAFVGGPETALLVGARLVALLLLAGLITLTTRTQDMIATLERMVRPLARIGVNPARTALALSLAVRFVPIMARITSEVREAQRVRGLENNILALAVPTIIRALRLTDEVADAIEARGFDPDKGVP